MTIHRTRNSSRHVSESLHFRSLKSAEESLMSTSFRNMLLSGSNHNTDKILNSISCKVSNFWGYEIRLAKENPADLLICVSKTNKEILLQNLQQQSFESPQWQSILKILKVWADNTDPLSDEIANIWLEFDQNNDQLPNPNFFFAPNPTLHSRSLREVYTKIFNGVLETNLDKATLDKFESVCKSFPSEAWAPQVGMMLARNYTNIRLYIHQIPAHQMIPYLSTIGWEHSKADFKELYESLCQFTPYIDLDIDINQKISAPIGLECYFKNLTQNKLERFLNFLKNKGYACEAMCTKLMHFFKESNAKSPFAPQREFLHHIKITYNPLGNSEAKVYLGMRKNDC